MISDFISSFTEELAKPSRFRVMLIPKATSSKLSKIIDAETLSLRCESALLPGRTLSTSDLRIYGPTEKFPYQSSYEDATLTFIVTDSMTEKLFFNQWMEIINPQDTWNFEYKKNYVMDIQIEQYDNMDNVTHTVKLIDAFPIAVNQLDLNWSSQNDYHKLSVVFAYTYWQKPKSEGGSEADAATTDVPKDSQISSNIPSLLLSNPDTQLQGTYLDISNQSIGPFDTAKDQLASSVNLNNQTGGIGG